MPFAVQQGSWLFIAIFIACLVTIAYSYYTRRGSAINQRTHQSPYSDAPGAKGASTVSNDRDAGDRLVGRRRDRQTRRRAKR
ncbi:MAG TPA: hypothetical protein VKA96_09215 [Solirubrobacteraceae bacterium]|nr:hypothetical protein [Solirubrobacteraceae bacterium]